MAALFAMGPLPSELPERHVLYWIEALVSAPDDEMCHMGRAAAADLLRYNRARQVLAHAIDRCYAASENVSAGYFLALSKVLLTDPEYPISGASIALLVLVLGRLTDRAEETRTAASRLVAVLVERLFPGGLYQARARGPRWPRRRRAPWPAPRARGVGACPRRGAGGRTAR